MKIKNDGTLETTVELFKVLISGKQLYTSLKSDWQFIRMQNGRTRIPGNEEIIEAPLFFYSHYGSSAIDVSLHQLHWLLTDIFNDIEEFYIKENN